MARRKSKSPKTVTRTITTTKSKGKGRQRKHKRPHLSHSRPARSTVFLSPCAREYARSLVNPNAGPVACVPSYPPTQSRKIRVNSRGMFTTSTTNPFGFILADPVNAVGNNAPCVFASLNTYAGTTAVPNTGITGVTSFNSNSDYVAANFGPASSQLQYRVVSAILRIQYAGTKLNDGGFSIALQEPTHEILTSKSFQDFQNYDDAETFRVEKDWIEILYSPQPGEERFSGTAISTSADQTTNNGHFYMGVVLQSAAAAQPFTYEFWANLEVTGPTVRGATSSHFDPVGFAGITTALNNSRFRKPHTKRDQDAKNKHEEPFLQEVGDFILKGITWVGHAIGAGVQAVEDGMKMAAILV